MKYCTKCGNELKNKDLYCSKCGTKVEKEIKEAKEVKNTNSEEVDSNFTINKRDIATQIILTVITIFHTLQPSFNYFFIYKI